MIRFAFLFASSKDRKRHICIDAKNENAILDFLEADPVRERKFNYAITLLLEHKVNKNLYGSEQIDGSSKNVTAIKLFKRGQNSRLYCKEQRTQAGIFYIIIAELLQKKKVKKVTGEVKQLIKKVATYEYEILDR